ncbi:MAG TPA: hypothetical protein VF604_02140 [Pyrinomonadaceae bacterium]|jgi:hypothetical protein
MMRKITGIFAAVFTFSLSVTIYYAFLSFAVDKSPLLVKPPEYSSLPLISLCEATSKPELYETEDIRIRVHLSGKDGIGFSVLEPEGNCERSSAQITFSYENEYAKTDELLKQLTAQSAEGSLTTVEVEVVGKLVDEYKFSRPFFGRFSIAAKEVRQISPIRQTALPDFR